MVRALAKAYAVVAAAKSVGRIVSDIDLPPDRGTGPRCFVDLGLPRNVDPEVGRRPGVELVDLSGLPPHSFPSQRLDETTRVIDSAAEEGIVTFGSAASEPWVDALRAYAEGIRREEWERALRHTGPISDEAREAFERFSERLLRRLLSGPTAELRSLPPGPEMDGWRRRVLELIREADRVP